MLAQARFHAQPPTQLTPGGTNNGVGPHDGNSGAPGSSSTSPTQTIGANGATTVLAASISEQAKLALSKGQISGSEYNMVIALANEGHNIAMMQGLLEGASQSTNGNSNAYAHTNLNFNGQTYTTAQLNAQLQQHINTFTNMQKDTEAQAGVTRTVELLALLQNAGGQIIINAGNTAQNTESASRAAYSYTMSKNSGQDAANTHNQAGQICSGGNGSDSGTHCN